jgi:hypothetical protein
MLAHNVGGGALPAPPWLLSYLGVAIVVGTAAALRATWPSPRGATAAGEEISGEPRTGVGNVAGLVLFAGLLYAAVVGPDLAAANIAPVAVYPVWYVGLPILCLLLGDVFRLVNPFVPVVALLERRRSPGVIPAPPATTSGGPAWTSAAFLAGFSWYFLAYHRPGSPRALGVLLGVYAAAAVAGGLRWGRGWLADGDAFAGISAAASRVGLRRPAGPAPAGTAALMIVLLGSTAFDAFSGTPFWTDVRGTSRGWSGTALDTVGLVWLTAVAAGAFLLVVRLAERLRAKRDAESASGHSLAPSFGVALVPLALSWFLAHDLTLLLAEGQNFYALLSDPLGKGWDVFGTLNHTIDFDIVLSRWVRWTQVTLLVVGHVAAVVLLHDVALRALRRRAAMSTTWGMAAVTSGSIVGAALLVLT